MALGGVDAAAGACRACAADAGTAVGVDVGIGVGVAVGVGDGVGVGVAVGVGDGFGVGVAVGVAVAVIGSGAVVSTQPDARKAAANIPNMMSVASFTFMRWILPDCRRWMTDAESHPMAI